MTFPSREFDDAVAAVCHGVASDWQMGALNDSLRSDVSARDEYLLRVELHSSLASNQDLVARDAGGADEVSEPTIGVLDMGEALKEAIPQPHSNWQKLWPLALAAGIVLFAVVGLSFWFTRSDSKQMTSDAVAVLVHAVDVRWDASGGSHAVGAALSPGRLSLETGLAQVVFYSGARVVLEGPAELRLISSREAFCASGLVSVEVPPQAHGFQVGTPQLTVVDLGTAFGLDVNSTRAEVHVFQGKVECQVSSDPVRELREGTAAAVDGAGVIEDVPLNQAAFARAADLHQEYLAAQQRRYEQWRVTSARLDDDPALLIHLDFEDAGSSAWALPNRATRSAVLDASVVGCQESAGRWPDKQGLEFRSMSDRVRLSVPGEFQSLTLAAWVNIKGLDRPFNSLFMADGFEPGEIHWQIRNDGSLDLGIQAPRVRDCQILAGPSVIGLERFGQWLHLSVVVNSRAGEVVHFLNGSPISRHPLELEPPFRIGDGELGNWNTGRGQSKSSYFVRHFSGVMDEFVVLGRALNDSEIQNLYEMGNPHGGP